MKKVSKGKQVTESKKMDSRKPNAFVEIRFDKDEKHRGKYDQLALCVWPVTAELGLRLGRFYLVYEEARGKDDLSGGAFGPCMDDERDAPMEMMDVTITPKTKGCKKELKRVWFHPDPKWLTDKKKKS